MDKFVFSKSFLVLMTIAVLLLIWIAVKMYKMGDKPNQYNSYIQQPPLPHTQPLQQPLQQPLPPTHPTTFGRTDDVVRDYDYSKATDILEEPTRRVPRHEMHPYYLRSSIDIPTRGYPDNFTQIGVLVRDDKRGGKRGGERGGRSRRSDDDQYKDDDDDDDYKKYRDHDNSNRIIRLFGRQEYPGSSLYEYYISVNSGYDSIKIPLEVRRREIYDGDKVYVKELQAHYRANIFKFDGPKYYPDVLL